MAAQKDRGQEVIDLIKKNFPDAKHVRVQVNVNGICSVNADYNNSIIPCNANCGSSSTIGTVDS